MEIYADERTERVYVRHDRGPYRVLEPDGSIGESYLPRGGYVSVDTDAAYSGAYNGGYDEGRRVGQREGALATALVAAKADDARRRLAFLVALRYHPLSLKGAR